MRKWCEVKKVFHSNDTGKLITLRPFATSPASVKDVVWRKSERKFRQFNSLNEWLEWTRPARIQSELSWSCGRNNGDVAYTKSKCRRDRNAYISTQSRGRLRYHVYLRGCCIKARRITPVYSSFLFAIQQNISHYILLLLLLLLPKRKRWKKLGRIEREREWSA